MTDIKKILLATDLSDTAARALQHARLLRDKYQAELHVLNVYVEPVQIYGVSGLSIPVEPTPAIQDRARAEVAQWCEEEDVLVAEYEVDYSVPHAIIHYAEDQDIDLIVIGSRGREGAARFFLGSVASEVVRRSDTPVLVVGPAGECPEEGYRKILTAIDFSGASLAACQQAVQLSRKFNAALTALHVIDIGQLPPYYPDFPDEFAKVEMSYARGALKDILTPVADEIVVDQLVTHGTAHKTIAEVAMDTSIDLVVMGTAGLGGLDRLFTGSVADRVLRVASCPVLVVHDPASLPAD